MAKKKVGKKGRTGNSRQKGRRRKICEAVKQIDAMTGGDPEADHSNADNILLDWAPKAVQDAYARLVDRCSWWAYA